MVRKLQVTSDPPSHKAMEGQSKTQVNSNKMKVAVGLSGGVDSSVSAALLMEQGYEVTGVFLTCWDENRPGCRIDQDRKDALDVAIQLGIPFVSLDFKQEYKEKVIDYFYREYQAGRTPNPDTMCNREIKFGIFYQWAIEQNEFDYIATGHYARVANSILQIANGKQKPYAISHKQFALQRGIDPKKDQSYFLYQLRPEQLEHILFPIGHLTKDEVRAAAVKRGLKTAKKPDSQGICFIGDIDVQDFLRERIEEKEGEVVIGISANSKSQIANSQQKPYANLRQAQVKISNKQFAQVPIGTHTGVPFYTIGQKVGNEIDQALLAQLSKSGQLDFDPSNMPPLFVIDKDIDKNQLVVGTVEQTYSDEFSIEAVNWLIEPAESEFEAFVRIRHGGELIKAGLVTTDNGIQIKLASTLRGVAPGQACVIYSSDDPDAVVLGGGVISS